MNESTFEADFQTFLLGGLFQPCVREDLERERRQQERVTSLLVRCHHGNRPLQCRQCYFERDPPAMTADLKGQMRVCVLTLQWGDAEGDHRVLGGVYEHFLDAVASGVAWRRATTNPDTWFSVTTGWSIL